MTKRNTVCVVLRRFAFMPIAVAVLSAHPETASARSRPADTLRQLIVVAQASDLEALRADVAEAEAALAAAIENDGDVRAARRDLQRARRRLARSMAESGEFAPRDSDERREAAGEEDDDEDGDRRRRRKARDDDEGGREVETTTEDTEKQRRRKKKKDVAEGDDDEDGRKVETTTEDTEKQRRRKKKKDVAEEAPPAEPEIETTDDTKKRRRPPKETAQDDTVDEPERQQTGIRGEEIDPQLRELRRKLRAERRRNQTLQEQLDSEEGEVIQTRRNDEDRKIIRRRDGRVIIRSDSETDRLLRNARDVEVVDLPRGRTRTTITRRNGSQIVTVTNRRGEIIYRVRRDRRGREVVLIDNRRRDDDRRPAFEFRIQLPPVRVGIPRDQYIVDLTEQSDEREIERTLQAPPVTRVERGFTLDEIRYNEDVRNLVRRIDLDAITFDTGSATISRSQVRTLRRLGRAIEDLIYDNPYALILVEGHTDAVGSEFYNLALSDRRAETVAIVLSENFDIPPENLITQGYGEEYLKIPTLGPERRNRRVTVRNISDLMETSDLR